MSRYFSTVVSIEGSDDYLWTCSKGCDALPMWPNLIVALFLILLIALTIRY